MIEARYNREGAGNQEKQNYTQDKTKYSRKITKLEPHIPMPLILLPDLMSHKEKNEEKPLETNEKDLKLKIGKLTSSEKEKYMCI